MASEKCIILYQSSFSHLLSYSNYTGATRCFATSPTGQNHVAYISFIHEPSWFIGWDASGKCSKIRYTRGETARCWLDKYRENRRREDHWERICWTVSKSKYTFSLLNLAPLYSEAFVTDTGCNLFSLDLRNGQVLCGYKGVDSITGFFFTLLNTS